MSKKKVNKRADKEGGRIAGGLPMWSQQGEEILESIREHVLYYRDAIGTVALGQAILEKGDARRIAFYDLVRIVDAFLRQLIEWALEKGQGELHELAGQALAHIGGRVQNRHKKLCAVNAAYLSEIKKIGREKQLGVVLFPESEISRLVQRELFTALEMRRLLLVIRAIRRDVEQRGWESKELLAALDEEKARLVPREYLAVEKLPPFSSKSEPRWWKFLWPRIWKKIDVSKMLPLKKREYEEFAGKKKDRKRYFSDLQKQSRDHLKTLARLFEEGLL